MRNVVTNDCYISDGQSSDRMRGEKNKQKQTQLSSSVRTSLLYFLGLFSEVEEFGKNMTRLISLIRSSLFVYENVCVFASYPSHQRRNRGRITISVVHGAHRPHFRLGKARSSICCNI